MKKILALSIFIGLLSLPLQAGTVAYYEFNGTGVAPVGSTIPDSTGNHPGTVAGGDLEYGMDSLAGSYLRFESNSVDRVEIPGAPDLVFHTDGAYTIEVVFRTWMLTSAVGALVSKGADVSNPDSQWWLRYRDGARVSGLIEGTDNTTEDSATTASGFPLNDGNWHHVALVFNGTVTPKKLEIYLDGVWSGSDASVGTAGVVGGVDTDPVVIGEFASLAVSRSFAGDIAALRLSDTALTPAEFLKVLATYITDITPTNRASFLPPSTVAGFVVHSPTIGVAASGIQVKLNGVDVSSQLTITGSNAERTVTLPALAANEYYRMEITVTDLASNVIRETVEFNTFVNSLLFIEGEDYNFGGGQFIDNPVLSSVPGPNNYLDRWGIEGIDYHQTNTPTTDQYRIGDQVGTVISGDVLRQAYLDAQVNDPGVADYVARDFANSEWVNYTRTFPAGSYRVYARVAKTGTVPIVMGLDEVTSGSTGYSQTLAPIGVFRGPPTPAMNLFEFIPLTDALGHEVAVSLSGVKTLRLTMVSGTAGMYINYLLFVPVSGTQPPFVASLSPAAGAGNEPASPAILISIRNAATQVNTSQLQLQLDGVAVTAGVAPTAVGVDLSYSPSLLTTGWHTLTLVFQDSAANTVSNQWQFMVANQAVRGYWKFDEQPPGSLATTNAGAILDASGNTRHGTATTDSMDYVTGSFNYGNTRALQFSGDPDRVIVSDPSDSLNFTGSFTFEAVVRTLNTTTTTAAILAKNGTGDGEGEYWWRLPGADGGKQRLGANGYFLAGTNALNDGVWHHLAAVYDQAAGELRLYADYTLDGVLGGVAFDKPVGRPADLQIGAFLGTVTSEFEGDIDFIRISDGALAPAQFIQTTVALQPILKSALPADGARNVAPKPLIRAEYQNRDTAVVLSSMKLFVDGNDVTAGASKTSDGSTAVLSYTPATALALGPHTLQITFNDTAVPANSWTNSWSFNVVGSVPVLGFYQFNEKAPGNPVDNTAGAILDASGYARHATATGALAYVSGSLDYGSSSALQFLVGGGPVVIPDPAGVFNWTGTQSVTLEAVIRTVTIGENSVGSLLAKQGATPGEWWWRINATGKQQFYVHNGSGSRSASGNAVLNDGNWHHVAAVFDGVAQQVRVYVDYKLDGSGAAVFTPPGLIGNSKNVWIGAFQNMDREFDGDIDLVRISGEALDPSWFVPLGGLAAPVKILNTVIQAGSISFSFATENGRSYVVEAADSLGGAWTDLDTVTGDGTVKTVTYPASLAQRYFRIRNP
jgi:hypothetical protein